MARTTQRTGTRDDVPRFLVKEVELLNEFKMHEWLENTTDDIVYQVPTRVTREVGEDVPEFSKTSFHLDENRETLQSRIDRHDNEYAWAENPRTRTRRLIGNIRLAEEPDSASLAENGDEVVAKDSFHMFHSTGDTADHNMLSGKRESTLRLENGDIKLAKRIVYLDHTVMPVKNLTVFF